MAPNMAMPGGEQPKRAHLYIGNLSPRVTEYMLHEIFSVAGPVLGVKIIPDRDFAHGGINYGFVEYHELRSAETALQTLNGRKIFDLEIKCNWAYQNQAPKEDLTNHFHVFVGDLSPEVNDATLQKAFAAFGTLSDARVMWDMASGKSRGYGFLAFRERADAEQAINTMNGEWLGSRAIRVNWANQKNAGLEGGMPSGGSASPMTSGGGGGGGGAGGASGPLTYESALAGAPQFNTTIYVGNLTPYTSQADLVPLFQGFGYIVEIRMQADRGFAFVKMDSHENAAMAMVHLSGTNVHGRQLRCSWGRDRDATSTATPSMGAPMPQYGAAPAYGQQQYPQAAYQQPGQQAQGQSAADAAAYAQWYAQYGAQYAAWQAAQRQQGAR